MEPPKIVELLKKKGSKIKNAIFDRILLKFLYSILVYCGMYKLGKVEL